MSRIITSLAAIFLLTTSLSASATSDTKANFSVSEHPRLLINQDAVEHAKRNMQRHEWAANNAQSLIEFADAYKAPKLRDFTVVRGVRSWKSMGYSPQSVKELFTVGLAYTLTENPKYLDMLKSFVLDACDPALGYIKVGAASSGVEVHEGLYFFYYAAICDILYSVDGLISDGEKDQIEEVMRTYLYKSKDDMSPNGIMNHQASTNSAAILVSMFLQDEDWFNHFVEADGGMIDHIAKGFMPDGWWFEGTINYCYLVADIYYKMAQVFQNNGMDLYHQKIAARSMDKDFHNAPEDFTGMKFTIWGPEKPYRSVYDMATAYTSMMDEDGLVVASNDTGLTAPAEFYELAYKEFGDKEFAWIISKTKRDSWVSLFYGVGKLPNVKDPRTKSATAENVGLTALRAQNKNLTGKEQLQAYVKYGSHGGWHGHFDRTSLQALDKYGHKYFGTEMGWFGYFSAEYKELIQTSVTHNMVIVNEMQQEAVPSSQPIFYAGDLIQVSVTESEARWRPIPIQNLKLAHRWQDFDYSTEPILQRRVSILTDEYIVLIDYMSSTDSQQYDCLMHPLGFVSIEGAEKVGNVLPAVTDDSSSPYKYFKDCQWYRGVDDSVKFTFNDKGFGLDVYALWPKRSDILYATYPTKGKPSGIGLIKNHPDRRTIAVRAEGKEMVFINLMEPYKAESTIKSINVIAEDQIEIELKDGTKHSITIAGLRAKNGGRDIKIEFAEKQFNNKTGKEGKTIVERNQ